jgi:hypothetical protein
VVIHDKLDEPFIRKRLGTYMFDHIIAVGAFMKQHVKAVVSSAIEYISVQFLTLFDVKRPYR